MTRPSQTVDKITDFRQLDESFDQTFSKVCGVEGEKPSSRSAEREIFHQTALFFLPSFFFCASLVKRKSGINEFAQINKLYAFGLHSEEPLCKRFLLRVIKKAINP